VKNSKHTKKGLSHIDVPDTSAETATSGYPNCPTTWKGPWRSVTNPQEIAQEVCKINANQYHQAHCTPFGSGPVADMFGQRGNTRLAQLIYYGVRFLQISRHT
jgi:hypothetical protein